MSEVAATTAGAPATAGDAPAAATTDTQTTQQAADWTTGLDDDGRGFVQTKGWKAPGELLTSYRNLEKTIGVPPEQIVRLPAKDDDADGWSNVYSKLGRPAEAKDYNIEVPEGGDPKIAEFSKSLFHKHGLSKRQGEAIAAEWNQHVTAMAAEQATAQQAQVEADTAKLQAEWGAAHAQNVAVAQRAAQTFGIDAETIDKMESAMGFAGVMKLFHNIGAKMGEDSFVTGNKGGPTFGVMTPEQARSRIQALRSDNDFVKRFTNGDVAAKEEFERLHKWAAGSN